MLQGNLLPLNLTLERARGRKMHSMCATVESVEADPIVVYCKGCGGVSASEHDGPIQENDRCRCSYRDNELIAPRSGFYAQPIHTTHT